MASGQMEGDANAKRGRFLSGQSDNMFTSGQSDMAFSPDPSGSSSSSGSFAGFSPSFTSEMPENDSILSNYEEQMRKYSEGGNGPELPSDLAELSLDPMIDVGSDFSDVGISGPLKGCQDPFMGASSQTQ